MRLIYDAQMLSFDDNNGFSSGDFFKQDEISLVVNNTGYIHLSLSLTQGTEPVKGDGSLAVFTFSCTATGNTQLIIDESELFFYDELGNTIAITDLTVEPIAVSIEWVL